MPTGEPVEEQPQEETESQEQPQEQTPSNPEPENEQPSTEQLVPERTHTVREGDSLWDIAIEYDVTVDQLLQLNPEVSKSMLVGQTLIISQASDSSDSQESSSSPAEDAPAEEAPSEEESPAEEETASAEESSSSRTHTVQDGDSLWDIATQYDVSVEQLQQLNPEVSKSMLVGETLMIPPADSSDAADKQMTSDSVSAEAEKSSETSTASTEQPEQTQTEKAAEEPLSANNEIISFVQSIRVERGLYPVSSVESLQSINVKLDSVVEGEQTYTIQQGDSPSLVADKVGIPTQTLINLNPDVTQSMLVGDVLVISHEQPFLQTKTVKTVTEEKEIAFKTETELDHNKASGYEKVVQEGKTDWRKSSARSPTLTAMKPSERSSPNDPAGTGYCQDCGRLSDQQPVQLLRLRRRFYRKQRRRLHLAGQRRLHLLPDLGIQRTHRHRHRGASRNHHLGFQRRNRRLCRLVQRLRI